MQALHSTAQAASSLHSRLTQWLNDAGHVDAPFLRNCYDPDLVLPTTQPIGPALEAAGASRSIATRASELYVSAVAQLAQSILAQFRTSLQETQNTHEFCESSSLPSNLEPCRQSQRIATTFHRLFERKKTTLMNDTLERVAHHLKLAKTASRPLSTIVHDYTPILDFAYTQSPKPTRREKELLAKVTGLTLKQVGVWFQNRRTREKAGAGTKNRAPKTLAELEERLRDQQRMAKEFRARQKDDEDAGHESGDSGYASTGPRSTKPATVSDITNMLKAFHIADDTESPAPPKRKSVGKTAANARKSSHSENVELQAHAGRPVAGKPKRVPAQHLPATDPSLQLAQQQPVAARATKRAPRPAGIRSMEPASSLRTPTSKAPQASASTRVIGMAVTNEAEATSSSKASRSRKKAALPTRRPKASRSTRGTQAVSSSSSGSSLPSLSPSSSRSSSLSTDGTPDIFSSPAAFSAPLPQTDPVYYTKNANGEFVPVTTPIVVRPQIVVPPPVHIGYPDLSLDFSSLFDHSSLGPVGPQMVAPDSDPRAFSSNILGSTMEPVITTEDFSALLELLSENAGDASTSGTSALDFTSTMPPLQGPPLTAGHDALSIAPIPDPTSLTVADYDFGSVVWPEFDETSWSQLLGLA